MFFTEKKCTIAASNKKKDDEEENIVADCMHVGCCIIDVVVVFPVSLRRKKELHHR